MKEFYFEITDTFGSELNYSWVNRLKINAKSLHGALIKLSKHSGLKFKNNGIYYKAKNACIGAYLIDSDYTIEKNKFEEI